MAGSPLKRARNSRVREIDGQVEASVRQARAGVTPAAWRRLSPVEKLQVLYGLSLEAALEDLSYRGDEPYRLAARTSARHDVMMICAKYAIETTRERDARRLVEEFGRRLSVKSPERRRDGTGKFPSREMKLRFQGSASETARKFRISLMALRWGSQLGGADDDRPVVPARCGRRDACETDWRQLGRVEKFLLVTG
jgi:hypothetical protein